MNSPLDRLKSVTKQANTAQETRALYSQFISIMRDQGWSDSDVNEYAQSIGVLMGKDDKAALSLFPEGLYETANEARESAKTHWRTA